MSAFFLFNPLFRQGLALLPTLAHVVAWFVVVGILVWTLRQYDRPRRLIRLPETVDEPETDNDDHTEIDRDLRDAA